MQGYELPWGCSLLTIFWTVFDAFQSSKSFLIDIDANLAMRRNKLYFICCSFPRFAPRTKWANYLQKTFRLIDIHLEAKHSYWHTVEYGSLLKLIHHQQKWTIFKTIIFIEMSKIENFSNQHNEKSSLEKEHGMRKPRYI